MLQRRQQGQDLYADVECKCVSDSERAVDSTDKLMCSAPGLRSWPGVFSIWGRWRNLVFAKRGQRSRRGKSDRYIDPGREGVLKVVEDKCFVTASQHPAKPGQDNAEKKH